MILDVYESSRGSIMRLYRDMSMDSDEIAHCDLDAGLAWVKEVSPVEVYGPCYGKYIVAHYMLTEKQAALFLLKFYDN